MLHEVNFRLRLWRRAADPVDDYRSRQGVLQLVTALVGIDVGILEADRMVPRPEIPLLYHSGVVYGDAGTKDWRDIWTCLEKGRADCKSLAAWRVAELRLQGYRCRPLLKWYPGQTTYHVQVLLEDSNSVEDPSAILGMEN